MIYLLTFHGSVNYGAVFQAVALYKTIKKYGGNCIVIDYNRILHHKNFLLSEAKNWKARLVSLSHLPERFRIHQKFDKFTKENMNLSHKVFNGKESMFKYIWPKNETYLIGSDQVWNYSMTGQDKHYFLDFTDAQNKYSYASSFGQDKITKDEFSQYENLLKKFKRISVREESGKKIIKEYLGRDVEVVCDPTFLLEKEDWADIEMKVKKNLPQKYILLFLLSRSDNIIKQAINWSIKTGYPIYNIAYNVKKISNIHDINNVGPNEWLWLVRNSSYVFTNSFHGIALSLNMQKQVWVELSAIGRNTRIYDMTKRYGVESRILNNGFDTTEINYEKVNDAINSDRQYSLSYLCNIINEDKISK
ncbi:MAG: polysaccharide pyruvyl transferase family protein [Treponema sp.]|nr:polysaccharide pyruvyl transferase family protein [Treponema sp.]